MSWLEQIGQLYKDAVSHVFVLTGNIHDYVGHNTPLIGRLRAAFVQTPTQQIRSLVLYDLARGLQFGGPADEHAFNTLLQSSAPRDAVGSLAPFAAQLESMQADSPGGALRKIDRALRAPLPAEATDPAPYRLCVIIEHSEYLFPNGDLAQLSAADRLQLNLAENWVQDKEIGDRHHLLILLANAPHQLHPRLLNASAYASVIDLPLPDQQERQDYLQFLLDSPELQVTTAMSPQELAGRTSGLTRKGIEDIVFRAHGAGQALTPTMIHERKKALLFQEYGDVLQVENPEFGYERVAGHDLVKSYFQRHILPGLAQGDRRTPSGILLVGPSGTGKTWFAKATAKEAGTNFLSLNLGSLLNQYVGNSEANLDKALRAIWYLGGICLIDEFDQQVASRNQGPTGSSVDNRFLARLLAFMAEPKLAGRVVFLAATNRPDQLDPALRRSGRFDRKVAFLPPTATERAGALAALLHFHDLPVLGTLVEDLEQYAQGNDAELRAKDAFDQIDTLVKDTEGWVHSDLHNLLKKAWELARERDQIVSLEELGQAAQLILPSKVDPLMLEVSLAEVNDLSLLPADYHPLAQHREQLRQSAQLLAAPASRKVRD